MAKICHNLLKEMFVYYATLKIYLMLKTYRRYLMDECSESLIDKKTPHRNQLLDEKTIYKRNLTFLARFN